MAETEQYLVRVSSSARRTASGCTAPRSRTRKGTYEVQLKGGARLRVGRSRQKAMERRLGRIT